MDVAGVDNGCSQGDRLTKQINYSRQPAEPVVPQQLHVPRQLDSSGRSQRTGTTHVPTMTPSPRRPRTLFVAQQQVQQPATADTSAGVAQSPMQPNASPFVPRDSGCAACAQAGHLQHALAMCFHVHQQQQQHLWQLMCV